jgi:hypothetical protein
VRACALLRGIECPATPSSPPSSDLAGNLSRIATPSTLADAGVEFAVLQTVELVNSDDVVGEFAGDSRFDQ